MNHQSRALSSTSGATGAQWRRPSSRWDKLVRRASVPPAPGKQREVSPGNRDTRERGFQARTPSYSVHCKAVLRAQDQSLAQGGFCSRRQSVSLSDMQGSHGEARRPPGMEGAFLCWRCCWREEQDRICGLILSVRPSRRYSHRVPRAPYFAGA